MLHDYLRINTGQEQTEEAAYEKCVGGVADAQLDSAQGRKNAIGNASRCAADAYCATYGVPPGLCSAVAGPVVDTVVEFFSDLFGGEVIDCSRSSTFDPCDPCKWQQETGGSIFGGKEIGGYDVWRRNNPACIAWTRGAPERLKTSVQIAAGEALLKKYTESWQVALAKESGRPYAELQQDSTAYIAAQQSLIKKGAVELDSEEIASLTRGEPAAIPKVISSIESVEQTSNPPSRLKKIAKWGAVGAIGFFLFRRFT